ncbi:MAG: aldo/keto reductase [Anaerolineaceae bacterium]|nr:aldo/keto reductase [Anaerolineaceae bacterium]
MIYRKFQDKQLSALGFGTMRLPTNPDKSIDEPQVFAMTDYALEHGINYFDTAYPYHASKSEIVIGKALARHPRGSFYLADKYPGHQLAESYDPAEIFTEQLQKCQTDYFDFYLLHNVCEVSIPVYEDPRWGIMDYFLEQKALGKICHFGMSSHALPENLEKFLDRWGNNIEFVQIQLNYLDWSLQRADRKYRILSERNIPVWVMEPLHGGRLCNLSEDEQKQLKALRPDETIPGWAFRWLQQLPNVTMILSGMSNLDQMKENIKTFETEEPLNETENAALTEIAEGMKNALPCTSCRYCCAGCPMELDIPMLINAYNDARLHTTSFTVSMMLDTLPREKLPSACIGCGQCAQICPQKIDIPKAMKDFAELIPILPNWTKLCEERAAAAIAARQKK